MKLEQEITLLLDGGWEVTGKVIFIDDTKIVLLDEELSKIMVYKEKISASMKKKTNEPVIKEPEVKKVHKEKTDKVVIKARPKEVSPYPNGMSQQEYDEKYGETYSVPESILTNIVSDESNNFAVYSGNKANIEFHSLEEE